MLKLTLNFAQRFNLSNLLAVQEGNLGRTAPFFRILELVRFTDHEDQQIKKVNVGINQYSHEAPSAGWGQIEVDIETSDAEKLGELLRDCPSLRTVDHVWAGPILNAINASVTKADHAPTPMRRAK